METLDRWARQQDGQGWEVDEDIDRRLAKFELEYRALRDAERARFASTEYRADLAHNARVHATIRLGEAFAALLGTGLHIARIALPQKSFIVGSRGVAKLTLPGDTVIGSPNVEFWMPIAFDVALVWCGPPGVRLAEIRDHRMIRNANLAIASGSTLIASRSKELLMSLVDTAEHQSAVSRK